MMSYKKWDVVVTDFPFADKGIVKRRPSLVCAGPFGIKDSEVYWVLMITSTKLKNWGGDVEIKDFKKVGLPISSVIRTVKIACVDASIIRKKIGAVEKKTQNLVQKYLSKNIE